MKQSYDIWVLGGDLRQVKLANLLQEDGNRVHVYGMELRPNTGRLSDEDHLKGVETADCVILPLPAEGADGMMNAPLSQRRVALSQVVQRMRPGQLLCGGKLPASLCAQARHREIRVEDCLFREEFAVKNAVPTAEGAIQIAMEEMGCTLCGAEVLVIGYGRIGKVLAHRLQGLGVAVTVSARKCSDLAWIETFGCRSVRTEEIAAEADRYSLILNTVPTQLVDRRMLSVLQPECLVIDLAGGSGGVDLAAAEELGVKAIWARGLPGKVAPQTAGQILHDTIHHILQEVEV